MFNKKDKEPKLVGAREKHILATAAVERMRNATSEKDLLAYGAKPVSQTIPATFIFVASVILVMVSMESNPAGFNLHPTGIVSIDRTLFGSGVQRFTGDTDMDRLIVIFIRGAALSLLAGIAPFLAFVASSVVWRDRVSPFVACWGALVVTPLLYYAGHDFIMPLAGSLLSGH